MTTTDTDTQTEPEAPTAAAPTPATTDWTNQFTVLQARYPKVREPILVALHILMQNPNVSLDDAKAQAAVHGMRITAASVSAAQRLLSRQGGGGAPPTPKPTRTPAKPTTSNTARVRQARATPAAVDPEELIRGVVAKIQQTGNAEAERLRDAMRKAIELLRAAVHA